MVSLDTCQDTWQMSIAPLHSLNPVVAQHITQKKPEREYVMSTTTHTSIDGTVAPGFEGVADAFRANFENFGEIGASVAVYQGGQLMVDLWGGVADPDSGRAWGRDTCTIVYSVTKGATATVLHRLAQEGTIDLNERVAHYWPAFGVAGKDAVTVRQLFSHQVGLPHLEEQLSGEELFDIDRVAALLAAQTPIWEPGTAHGYHALTYGWLAHGFFTAATGESTGSLFRRLIAEPLSLDFWIGVPPSTRVDYAPLVNGEISAIDLDSIPDPEMRAGIETLMAAMGDPNSLFSRVLSTNGALPTPDGPTWNAPEIRAGEQPAAAGVTNARSLGKMYAATVSEVDGTRLLTEQTVRDATQVEAEGPDQVLLSPSKFGVGYQLHSDTTQLLSPASFGHMGAGGALGFADPDHQIGFGYVQNMLSRAMGPEMRTANLIGAIRTALG